MEIYKKKQIYNIYIPDEWEITQLDDVTHVITCGLASTPTYVNSTDGMPFFSAQNVQNGEVVYENFNYIPFSLYDQITKNNKPKKGDILYTRVGAGIGEAAIIEKDFDFGIYVSLTLIKTKNNILHNKYLLHLLNSRMYKMLAKRDQFAGGGVQNLNVKVVKKFLIPLPSFPEQRAIAACLSTWDTAIQKTTQLIAQKELRKKWLMQQLLTGKKRLPAFSKAAAGENGGEGEWKEYHLGDIFEERIDTGYDNLPLLSIGQLGIYPQAESIKKDTSNEDKSKYKRICPGDIGYNTMRMWQGRSALSQFEGIVSPAYTIVTSKEIADSMFFSYLFKTPKLMHLFWRNSQGLVDDTLNCKFKDFALVKVHLPQKKEQTAIAQVLQTADQEIQLLKSRLEQLQVQKKGMMQVLLTGKIRLIHNNHF